MNKLTGRLLYWTPRILGTLYILFIGLFALDAFDSSSSFGTQLLGFLIHLIPNVILALLLAVAWRWEWVGTVFFCGIALFYNIWAGDQVLVSHLAIAGPLYLIGILFLVGWMKRGRGAVA